MYLIRTIFAAVLLALPAAAQAPDSDLEKELNKGLEHFSEGTRLLLQSLIGELLPLFEQLEGMMDELNAYHPPEMLPNGDIIIRRKTPQEREAEEETGEAIDL